MSFERIDRRHLAGAEGLQLQYLEYGDGSPIARPANLGGAYSGLGWRQGRGQEWQWLLRAAEDRRWKEGLMDGYPVKNEMSRAERYRGKRGCS